MQRLVLSPIPMQKMMDSIQADPLLAQPQAEMDLNPGNLCRSFDFEYLFGRTIQMFKRLGSLLELDKEATDAKSDNELSDVMIIAREQIEYYLSVTNLDKDRFMREKLEENSDGLMPIDVIMNCNRIKQLGVSADELLSCCSTSHFLIVDFEKRGIRPKTPYKRDARRKQRTIRMTGFSDGETANSIYELLEEVTAAPENVLLQYSYTDSGDRTFTGAVNVLYHTEEEADAAVAAELMFGGKRITAEYFSDYEKKLKHEKRHMKESRS